MASGIWHLACQTYALNLIDSHSGQKQAPQLFSSSKSFRVAKSTPSSAKLSPISKWLPKPPLLFKSPLLSKSALVLAPLLLLSYTQGAQALSAYTSRIIEGSAPYLTFDGGRSKATNTDTFLAIELPDGRTITPSTNTSSSTNPIMLPSGNFTFNDIHMVIPSGSTATSLNSLISQGKWGDDDGDGQVTATGNVSVSIYDKDGRTVSRGNTLNICSAPYKVTLSSTGGSLATQYGIPNSSTFSGGTAEYYITLPSQPVICYARPNLNLGTDKYAGPVDIWNPARGFLVQSSYSSNFPTTGRNGSSFYLDISGIDASQLTWSSVSRGGITVSVRSTGSGAQVGLSGPVSSQERESTPDPIARPSLPQTFELEGRDSSGNVVVKYGFVLKKWFVIRRFRDGAQAQIVWCDRLGYRLARVRDLTNARFRGLGSSSGNHYQRRIGAGFFTEWGSMGSSVYFTKDSADSHFNTVNSNDGYVSHKHALWSLGAICTTP
ncbi:MULTISPECIES: hypothetical protein [unclassified Gilliamella]|uniref:hypothetical protein n=1 Tax=unclassified Gilliamella TaxID=2685620 RepID=UPI00132B8E4F|nr:MULTISPECIES: hypothetical protein [unclassified Gilliamella]MWN31533.1 hypothetical protein [Gilliamella sp. Pra-s60]MWP28640.1 hypothetical protein [Gilliamella sp. Pra-s54]